MRGRRIAYNYLTNISFWERHKYVLFFSTLSKGKRCTLNKNSQGKYKETRGKNGHKFAEGKKAQKFVKFSVMQHA
jgi:hypothetical protein